MKKRIFCFFLALTMMIALLPTMALAETITSGKCGENATWSYDQTTKTLMIAGSGAMYDYEHEWDQNPAPWSGRVYGMDNDLDIAREVETVIIGSDITRVGNEAFGGEYTTRYPKLKNITFAQNSSVTEIGAYAFEGADALESIILPKSLQAFKGNDGEYTEYEGYDIPNTVFPMCSWYDGDYIINFKAVYVQEGNQTFRSDDGVLYKGSALLVYPMGRTSAKYIIPTGTTKVPRRGMFGNEFLQSVSVPRSVKKIPEGMFLGCRSLREVSLSEGIEEVNSNAFWCCESLKRLDIPASVTRFVPDDADISWASGYDKDSTPLDIYFSGMVAPEFETNNEGVAICTTKTTEGKVTIHYPAKATGWDAVQAQENVKAAVAKGLLAFEPYNRGESKPNDSLSVDFQYASTYGGDATYSDMTYKDSWFFDNASVYNHDLARMSLGLAMAGFGSNVKTEKDANVKKLFSDLNFDKEKYYSVGYDKEDNDTVAMALDSKTVIDNRTGESYTLLGVCLRGADYGTGGWKGNFNVENSTAYHAGFDKAAIYARGVIKKYIEDNGINSSRLRIWLTGYSRSAATANLLSAKLKNAKVVGDGKIYTYTFATPNNQLKKIVTSNKGTFNLINPLDVVPQVPLSAWNFGKMGTTYMLPKPYVNSSIVATETWLLNIIRKVIPTREWYYSNFEAPIMAYISGDKTALDAYFRGYTTLDEVFDTIKNKDRSKYLALGVKVTKAAGEIATDTSAKYLLEDFLKVLNGAADDLIEGTDSGNLQILFMLADIGDKKIDSILAQQHYPEVYLSLMMQYDENALTSTNEFTRKTAIISCPVDVNVYNEDNQLVAQVIDDKVIDIDDSDIEVEVMGESDKVFVLPNDQDYRFELSATDEGTMDYSILENCADGSIVRSVEFYSIKLTKGKTFVGEVNNIPNNAMNDYALNTENGVILPDYDSMKQSSNSGGTSSGGGGGAGTSSNKVSVGTVENGKITATPAKANTGEKVVLTPKADEGYELDKITVKDKDSKEVALTKEADGTYTFTMPEGGVDVYATFKKVVEGADKSIKTIKMQIGNKDIDVNGETITNDAAPIIRNDRTLIPIRFITETLGGKVDWNGATKEVTLTIDGKEIKMIIGKMLEKYGVEPVIIDGRTFVPVRFVADELFATVAWDDATKTVTIIKNKK